MNKLSIIIPVHDLEGYIGECLRSVAGQNYDMSKVQVICVLDRCTDASEREIDAAARESGLNVLKVSANNGNCGLSRNTGLARADGDYVWFVDGDDLLVGSDALSRIDGAATGDMVRPSAYLHGKTIAEAAVVKTTNDAYSFITRRDFIGGQLFKEADGIFESLRFFEALLEKSPQIVRIEQPVYFYRTPRAGSIMYNYRKRQAAPREWEGRPQAWKTLI